MNFEKDIIQLLKKQKQQNHFVIPVQIIIFWETSLLPKIGRRLKLKNRNSAMKILIHN